MAAAVRVAAISASQHKHEHKAPKKRKTIVAPRFNDDVEFVGWRKYQPAMDKIYTYPPVEYFVAFLIVANFFISITEKWIDPLAGHMNPDRRKYADTWNAIGLLFNILFLIEILANMYAYWLWDFWLVKGAGNKWSLNGWNCFDFIVVLIGWLLQVNVALPGPLKLLRLMRAFRVFRLFKRVKSLNKIIVSLGRAVPGMVNAMMIMLIVMSIYAMLGVEFFSHSFTPRVYEELSSVSGGVGYTDEEWILGDGTAPEYVKDPEKYECPDQLLDNETSVCYVTARGNGYGEEYFGNFGRSLYTLFQVLTGDSWSEAIARPMFEAEPIVTTLYFVSYVVFIAIILVNVVVAVLLEKMVDDGSEEEDDEEHYHHKSHDWVHPDAKATIGELWDLKQDIRAKHMIMQAQLDALTANIEALCAKQGVTPVSSAGLVKAPNELAKHDDEGYFDEKGNRVLEDKYDEETGASWKVEKVRSWVYTKEEVIHRLAEEQTKAGGGSKVAPIDADIQVVNIEES